MRFRSATKTRIGTGDLERKEECGRIMINFSGWLKNSLAQEPIENEKWGR